MKICSMRGELIKRHKQAVRAALADLSSGKEPADLYMIHRYEHHTQPILPRIKFLLPHAGACIDRRRAAGSRPGHRHPGLPPDRRDALAGRPAQRLHDPGRDGAGQRAAHHGGKLFASFYALFSGVVFLASAGLVIAPLAHRLLHWLHLEAETPTVTAMPRLLILSQDCAEYKRLIERGRPARAVHLRHPRPARHHPLQRGV